MPQPRMRNFVINRAQPKMSDSRVTIALQLDSFGYCILCPLGSEKAAATQKFYYRFLNRGQTVGEIKCALPRFLPQLLVVTRSSPSVVRQVGRG